MLSMVDMASALTSEGNAPNIPDAAHTNQHLEALFEEACGVRALPATVSTNSKVYFSAQLADNSSSTAATTTHPNMGWLQSRTVDSTGNIGTSGTATEWNDFVRL